MAENSSAPKPAKDYWDKVDIVLRPLNSLLTAVAVVLLGYFTSRSLGSQQASETGQRVYTELMVGREQAESSLRKDMFLSIIQTFQRPETSGIEAKMLNLEMLAYNFHESLNLKPLFSHLNRQIEMSPEAGQKTYFARLDQTAKEITTRQMVLLEQVGQTFNCTVDFEKFHPEKEGPLAVGTAKLKLGDVEREFSLSVAGVDPKRKELALELTVRSVGDSSSGQTVNFHVGFYDFPMIDNTRLSSDQRAAVILKNFESGVSAELRLIYFPGAYASLKERVSFDEILEKLRSLGNVKR